MIMESISNRRRFDVFDVDFIIISDWVLIPKTRVIRTDTMVDYNPLILVFNAGGWSPWHHFQRRRHFLKSWNHSLNSHYVDTEYLVSSENLYRDRSCSRKHHVSNWAFYHDEKLRQIAAGYRVPLDGLSINNFLNEDALAGSQEQQPIDFGVNSWSSIQSLSDLLESG